MRATAQPGRQGGGGGIVEDAAGLSTDASTADCRRAGRAQVLPGDRRGGVGSPRRRRRRASRCRGLLRRRPHPDRRPRWRRESALLPLRLRQRVFPLPGQGGRASVEGERAREAGSRRMADERRLVAMVPEPQSRSRAAPRPYQPAPSSSAAASVSRSGALACGPRHTRAGAVARRWSRRYVQTSRSKRATKSCPSASSSSPAACAGTLATFEGAPRAVAPPRRPSDRGATCGRSRGRRRGCRGRRTLPTAAPTPCAPARETRWRGRFPMRTSTRLAVREPEVQPQQLRAGRRAPPRRPPPPSRQAERPHLRLQHRFDARRADREQHRALLYDIL